MSNKKSKPLVTPEENIIRLGNLLYAIPGQFKKAEVIDITGGQVSIDTDPLVTISGDNIQELFYSTDEYITFLDQNAVLLITDQTVTGTKTWLDEQILDTGLAPAGSDEYIGTDSQPFNTGYFNSVYADEIISSGSPGLRLTHGGGAGIIDTTENNDLNFRRFGNSFLKFLASGISLEQDVVILGNMNVQGTTTSINTEQLLVEDNVITLNHNYTGMPMLDSGLVINRGTENDALLLWDELLDGFVAGISGSEEPITMRSDLIAASGVLQADINTRATYVQLVATSGVLQSDINDRVLRAGDTMSGSLLASSTSVNLGSTANRFGSVYTGQVINDQVSGDVSLTAADQVLVNTGGSTRWTFQSNGNLTPQADGTQDLGGVNNKINTAHVESLYNQDGVLTLQGTNVDVYNGSGTHLWRFDHSSGALLPGAGAYNIGASGDRAGTVYAATFTRPDGDAVFSASDDVIVSALGGSGDIFMRTGGNVDRWIFSSGGALYPNLDASYDIGLTSRACNRVFTRNVLSDSSLGLGSSNTARWTINTSAHLYPDTNGSRALGLPTNHVGTVYTRNVESNGTGNLTMFASSTGQSVQVGIGNSSNYANGAFLELHGNSSGGAGDVRLGSGSGLVRFYAGSSGGSNAIRWQIENNGRLSSANAGGSQEYFNITATAAGYASRIQQLHVSRAPSNLFYFLACGTNNGSNLTHILSGDGNIFIDGSFIDTGADYAEYFEFKDGTPVATGNTVVIDGDKVRAYDSETDSLDDIVGVVRPDGTATATNHPINWPGKYQKDEFGNFILDENGSKIESPEYDSEQEYIWRSKRPEWAPIGLVGQVQVLKSATKNPRWRKMKDLSATLELWFIR